MNNFSGVLIDDKMLIMIIIGVALFLLFCLLITSLIEHSKKKKKNKTVEVKEETISKIEKLVEQPEEVAKSILTAKEEIIIEEINDKTSELDDLLKTMEFDLEKQKMEATKVDNFEQEQEESAIISYQQLKEAVKNNLIKPYDDEIKENIFTAAPPVTGKDQFKNSEIISPIYGRIEAEVSYPKISLFEQTKNDIETEKILDELNSYRPSVVETVPKAIDEIDIQDEEEFLEILKEFRENFK